jgi:hypothetical protein
MELGQQEIDFRYSILQPQVGYRHFTSGISHLKMTSGREHRDAQRYIVAVIAGSSSMFVRCIRALADFYYTSQQEPYVDDNDVVQMKAQLAEFHANKDIIIERGFRENWHIPKLEHLMAVVLSVTMMGAPFQWSTDRSEHEHIEAVKKPFRASNHKNWFPQTCRWLDRLYKRRTFDIMTAMVEARVQHALRNGNAAVMDTDFEIRNLEVHEKLLGPESESTDYFEKAELQRVATEHRLVPQKRLTRFRTYATDFTAFHLNGSPTITDVSIEEAVTMYNLPNLIHAMREFFFYNEIPQDGNGPVLGVRTWVPDDFQLPFTHIQIWHKMRVQTRSTRSPRLKPSRLIHAVPPCKEWPHGRSDPCLFINETPALKKPWTGKADLRSSYHNYDHC